MVWARPVGELQRPQSLGASGALSQHGDAQYVPYVMPQEHGHKTTCAGWR
jgi:hypothetical protein